MRRGIREPGGSAGAGPRAGGVVLLAALGLFAGAAARADDPWELSSDDIPNGRACRPCPTRTDSSVISTRP